MGRSIGSNTVSVKTSIYPVTVRGPLKTNRSGVTTFARIEITDDALIIATSPNKGRTLGSVEKHPLPAGEPVSKGPKKASWGQWSWQGCGCTNSWGRQTRATILDKAV